MQAITKIYSRQIQIERHRWTNIDKYRQCTLCTRSVYVCIAVCLYVLFLSVCLSVCIWRVLIFCNCLFSCLSVCVYPRLSIIGARISVHTPLCLLVYFCLNVLLLVCLLVLLSVCNLSFSHPWLCLIRIVFTGSSSRLSSSVVGDWWQATQLQRQEQET